MSNKALAEIFYKMSELFEIKDSPWESRAYQRAARNIETLSVDISGMGPKKVSRLYKELGIDYVDKLEKAAKGGKIRALEGFGEKSEKDILSGISLLKRGRERMLITDAVPLAKTIVDYLKKCPSLKRIEIAGSTRRRKETIGDIDILAISSKPKEIMDAFTSMPNVYKVESKGNTKSAVNLEEGLDCDLRV